jgi:uncharacterized protein YvpB
MEFLFALTAFEPQAIVFVIISIASIISLVYLWHGLQPEIPRTTKKLFFTLSLILWIATAYGGWQMGHKLTAVPGIRKISPQQGTTIDPLLPDIQISFNAPVRASTISVHTYPEIEFSIRKSGYLWNLSPWATQFTIIPKTTLPPGEHFMVYFANIEGPFTSGYGGEQLLEVMTPETDITKVDPPEGTKDIPVKQPFTATTTTLIDEKEWSIHSDPAIPMTIKKENSKTLSITPNEPFRQSTTYTMAIIHTPIIMDRTSGVQVKTLDADTKETIHFTTVRGAFISSFAPDGKAINPENDIQINFDESMNTSDVIKHLSISPPIQLNPKWKDDDKTLVLSHDAFAKDTEYTVTLTKGLTTAKGGILENDAVFHFHTAGRLTVMNVTPAKGATSISNKTTIKLTFDQNVPKSIADHLTISPNVSGKIVTTDNTLEFTPDAPLSYETRYSFTLRAGAESVYGLPTSTDETFVFTTAQNQTILAVAYYHQQTLFTCNIAAARMLLAFRGINVTETDLINAIGLGGKRGSGNPYKGYIDDYGTYWDAVARGVSKYRPIRMITSGKLSDLLAEVKKGNPVMTWGQNGWSDPHDVSWTSTDGTFIKAVNGMHSAVVRGFSGPENNPTKIFINDPWRGQYGMPTAEFMRRWSYFSMAMVVE